MAKWQACHSANKIRECITASRPSRESDGDVVAVKRGNSRGAKVPCRTLRSIRREEIRLDNNPTTERRTGTSQNPEALAMPEFKSGLPLPPKVSELRWNIGQKAKQEPKFRFYALYDRIYRLDVLWTAWCLVAANDGAPGVDGVSCQEIAKRLDPVNYVAQLHEELRTKRYRPVAVKRAWIPKPGSQEKRPLESLKGKTCCRQVKFFFRVCALAVVLPFKDSKGGTWPWSHQISKAIKFPGTRR